MNEMAAIVSDVVGHEIRYQHVSFDAFKGQLLGSGVSESFAQGYVDMMRAKNDGMDNVAARTPENVTTTTFRQWCEEELKPALAS
ncbi:MAG: hypothetical protein IAI50_08195 [Candidatus Eremiobacteraeota bacterium]|nr:hypothetical protein [Candidatus Eremiobacteraeota bacterium]